MRKFLVLVLLIPLVLTMCVTAKADEPVAPVAITPSYDWYSSGATDPETGVTTYTIGTVADLAGLAKLTKGAVSEAGTNAATNFANSIVTLGADLTFEDNQYWYYKDGTTTFDYRITGFAGTFDGGSFTITGLKFKNAVNENPQLGLFQTITAEGSVCNLTVATVTAQTNTYDSFGFIARTLNGSASNCHVKGVNMSVTGYYTTCGFLFATVSGSDAQKASVTGCSVSDVIFKTTGNDNSDLFGGVIGSANKSTISDCTASNINFTFDRKTKRTGGLIGYSENTDVTNCTSTGVTITVGTYYQSVGGFVGKAVGVATYSGCKVENYIFNGSSSDYAGDVGGFAATTAGTVNFVGCSITNLAMNLEIPDNNNWSAGGFIGWQEGTVSISDCSVSGTIAATGAGQKTPVGGFVGKAVSGNLSADDCIADVNITAPAAAGGFVGDSAGGTFTNCTTSGTVTSENGTADEFIGTGSATMENCKVIDKNSPPSSGGYVAPSGHQFNTTLEGINKVTVGGKVLSSGDYTVVGTNVIISQTYIDTLASGSYKVVIENDTHIAVGTLVVKNGAAVESAKTFDAGIAIYAGMALTSALGAAYVCRKK